ncbi:hypothetical protein MAF45_09940 [Mesosutterella sp. OilRF-GAM-744-9]|uniref:Uncharacterized protein n=1 Tax=Mesosutterella porci TaxID=2915351 RepID=A0ABS9MT86_9BURK|nr:hypothetical protein [Mesosutterella sp. oilRF-744-WT-GAM-9]MCG5031757.1 hypothetical protein [Mesosutterella sp. oilRF-744-WT-GAM-9]
MNVISLFLNNKQELLRRCPLKTPEKGMGKRKSFENKVKQVIPLLRWKACQEAQG